MDKYKCMALRLCSVVLVSCLTFLSSTLSAQFTAGRIVALQVGNGTETLANTGNSIFLKEYTSTGTAGITVAIPNTGGTALIAAGNSTAEGYPSLTSDGGSIALAGYNAAIGGAVNLTTSTSAAVNRGIGLVNYAGNYSLESTTATAFSAGNVRTAASNGTNNFWAAGSNTGVAYFGDGTAATVSTTVTNNRALTIQNGQLYFSTGSGTNRGVYAVGTGTPVTSGTTATVVVNVGGGTASPYQYAFNAAGTVCYIADDRTIATGGGIQKWTFSGTWTLAYTMGTVGASTVGARGLIVDFSGAQPVIYATTSDAGVNRIIKITDTGTAAGANATATVLVTASASTAFRGLAFAPTCTSVDVVAVNSNSPFCTNEDLQLSATVTGTAPYTYIWSGAGTFSPDNTAAAPTVSSAVAGTYSVTVSNGCPSSDNGSTDVVTETPTLWYADLDGDGFGDEDNTLLACGQPLNYLATFGDCNDASATSFPGAMENLCDGVDNDCDGTTDEGRVDGCNDSSATNFNPAATCNNGSCTYTACDGAIGGLQDLIVETYYISDANDATDTNGGSLPEGSTTYRIYADLAPGYEIQAVYGNGNHDLRISTTTEFFNNLDRGETVGAELPDNRLDENTVALDSYVAMGGASTLRTGVLKTDDSDGSLVGGANSDGGSAGVAGGLLVNNDPLAGIELTIADGLILATGATVTVVGLDLSMFNKLNSATEFLSNGGAWSVLEGTTGPDGNNRVLIAQITTDGELSFELNIQLGTPTGGVEQYVANSAIGAERTCEALTYPAVVIIPGCTDDTACNYDAAATEDDGSCTYPGCTDFTACNYDNTAGCDDGSCILPDGCTDILACNYNEFALCDDGSCILPDGCTDISACNYDEFALCDDGSCILPDGCTDSFACNYNMTALCDNGTCTYPVVCNDPTACNYDGPGDCSYNLCTYPGCQDALACNFDDQAGCDDGSCTYPGCTAPTACNYDDTAGCDDGSCILPDGCTNAAACNYNAAALCDDGSCILPDGCTNIAACNYNAAALCDDGSCILPDGCTNTAACNYNAAALCDDGSCILPDGCTNAAACNYNAAALCDDGSCTFQGCTNVAACNYNATAGCDDGTCIVPTPNCFVCNGTNTGLVIADTDGDGICNANEIAGCTNITASNYNPAATDDNGSCVYNDVPACDGAIGGLEDVIVEKYYISDANDATDTDGGSLAAGSTTYRVYADLAPGYEIQAVFGNAAHQLNIATSTQWFNNADRGETSGNQIGQIYLGDNTVALDSWIGMSGASTGHVGVLKTEDTNGSIVGGVNNDGGSANIPAGLLSNNDPMAGIPLTTSDGLIPGTPPTITVVGLNVNMFDVTNSAVDLVSNGGAYSVLEGVQGPTTTNRVLIGQFTTTGDFSFTLNLQLGTAEGGVEQYVAINPVGAERTCEQLIYPPVVIIPGCTDDTACNYDAAANEDDGSCTYPGCTDDTACNYNDTAGCDDGSCTYPGCTDDTACNYDGGAGCDDGSCTFPGCTDVLACNYSMTAGCDDGSCTFPGCTDVLACNYNMTAGCDDGSCTFSGCTNVAACNYNATAGCDDGSCTFPGCTDVAACNYNATAGCDDGSCTFPGCTDVAACNYNVLAGCDDNSCTFPGCTDVAACNYIMTAGCDDGSCTYPGCTNPVACNYNEFAGCDDGSCFFGGCNDITACNFDPFAGCNDGSCLYPGCMDVSACNYDMTAGCDDGSCTYPGCTDVLACNYNMTAGCDDGSCTYPGCTDPTACNYDANAGCDDGSCISAPCDLAPNDPQSGAIALVVSTLGNCNTVTGDLVEASASPESDVAGADLWYTFTAVTPGARIEVSSSSDNISIELRDALNNLVDTENLVAGNGGEILNIGSLTTGATYYVAVNSVGENTGNGEFTICVQWIQDSECDYGPGPYSLCNTFKADWIGANGYAFEFTSNTTMLTYFYEKAMAFQPNTYVKLSDVPAIQWNDSYAVNCQAFYNLTNGTGASEKVYIDSDNICNIIISPEPTMIVRPSDNCANFGPHFLGQYIAGQPFICGAVDYQCEFTRTDIPELPITHLRGVANRFLQLSSVPGLTPGGVYSVRVRAVYSYGSGTYGAADCVSIIGPAGMQIPGDQLSELELDAEKMEAVSIESAIYPNPNAGYMLNINLTNLNTDMVELRVFDLTGQLVYSNNYVAENGTLNTVVAFGNQLAAGVYTLNFNIGSEILTERLVVTR